MAKNRSVRARVKSVAVGPEALLLLRFVPATEEVDKTLGSALRAMVSAGQLTYDGEVYRLRGEALAHRVVAFLRERCEVVYDANLQRDLSARPNPWPIPVAPLRDWAQKPVITMARVWHPELAEALAFQSPSYDDDFLIDFRRELAEAKQWRDFRTDLDTVPIWVVADHYAPRVHDVLDRYFECWWDEFLGGGEWNVLPVPAHTRYPERRLSDGDFAELGVPWGAALEELNAAYREKKEAYLEGRIHVEQWFDVEVAYQRIRRHHRPEPSAHPETVVAPPALLRLLREALPGSEEERVRWFHGKSAVLGGAPADLVAAPGGLAAVTEYLEALVRERRTKAESEGALQ